MRKALDIPNTIRLIIGCSILFVTEILRVYLIMPFPGSQQANTITLAWYLDHYHWYLFFLGIILICYPIYLIIRYGRTPARIGITLTIALFAVVFYFFNFRFEADKMFYQPSTIRFADAATNKVPEDKLVIGVVLHGEAKAYPIQIIGYHHQVRDTFGTTPVMITYCTVCRTGRIFDPIRRGNETQNGSQAQNGSESQSASKNENESDRPAGDEGYRLVGMDHFNAMFEDKKTKSWWAQATGIAIAGPEKGAHLTEFPSQQTTLKNWLRQHPDSRILQPDTLYKKKYDALALYDNGTIPGGLEHRDTSSWKPKSWVIGIVVQPEAAPQKPEQNKPAQNEPAQKATPPQAKAYDWNDLTKKQLIEDTIGSLPVLLVLGSDTTYHHAWSRIVKDQTLTFQKVAGQPLLADNTGSQWDLDGNCISGQFKDQQLQPLQTYQEFWHSWSHFHPGTTRYRPAGK